MRKKYLAALGQLMQSLTRLRAGAPFTKGSLYHIRLNCRFFLVI